MIMCLRSWGTIIEEDEEANKEPNIDISIGEAEFIY
jgi:hypothetical protein